MTIFFPSTFFLEVPIILKSEVFFKVTCLGIFNLAAMDAIGPKPEILPEALCINSPSFVKISLAFTPHF